MLQIYRHWEAIYVCKIPWPVLKDIERMGEVTQLPAEVSLPIKYVSALQFFILAKASK